MAKQRDIIKKEVPIQQPQDFIMENNVQNDIPFTGWPNFDVFWSQVVRGRASATVKMACKEHIKALGLWDDQSKWIDALEHFGIPVE